MRVFLILIPLLFVSFCSEDKDQEPENNIEPENIRFLALGDSYTIGAGVHVSESWPLLLAESLTEAGYIMEDPVIIARTGWTTEELRSGISGASPQGPFDFVSLLIGVNNQYRGIANGYTLEDYRDEFRELVQKAIDFAGGSRQKVFIVSIPDYSVTPFVPDTEKVRVSEEIDRYNAVNREIAESFNVKYFDITPSSRLAGSDSELLAPDGLHPSGKMYAMWVNIMKEDIVRMLP